MSTIDIDPLLAHARRLARSGSLRERIGDWLLLVAGLGLTALPVYLFVVLAAQGRYLAAGLLGSVYLVAIGALAVFVRGAARARDGD